MKKFLIIITLSRFLIIIMIMCCGIPISDEVGTSGFGFMTAAHTMTGDAYA
jgi:hypothetical protein